MVNMDKENKEILSIVLLIFLPIILFFASFLIGRYPISPLDVINTILCPIFPQLEVSSTITTIVFEIRLPRIIAALVVGAALAMAGAAFQSIFKNPLVSSDLLGVSNGAGFGAALAIILSGSNVVVQIFAFIFGLISVSVTYLISRAYKAGGILILVLSGVAISAFFNSLISAIKFVADPDDKLPEIVYWLMGSLASVTMDKLVMILIPIIIGFAILLLLRWHMNLLAMGDEEAQSLGLNPSRVRLLIIAGCTLLTSAAVSVSGVIGWIGLVIPHMTRMIVGPDNRILLPASLSLGASFLLLIDNISRAVIAIEIPIGILTAIIGVPIFLYLLKRGYSEWS
jgi:iron complex transport system permease protein